MAFRLTIGKREDRRVSQVVSLGRDGWDRNS